MDTSAKTVFVLGHKLPTNYDPPIAIYNVAQGLKRM